MTRAHHTLTALTLTALVGLPFGCSSAPKDDDTAARPPAPEGRRVIERTGARPVSETIGAIGAPRDAAATLVTTQRLTASRPSRIGESGEAAIDAAPGDLREVRYSVREAPAADVLRVLVGELLERPYVLAPGVAGEITFDLDTTMTTGEIERFVGALASAFGWTIQDREGVLVFSGAEGVAQAPEAPMLEGDATFPSDAPALRVFHFDYLASTDARAVVQDLSNKAIAKAVPVGPYLVLAERTEQLKRYAELFDALDAPVFDGAELWTYELAHSKPQDMIEALRTIGTSAGVAQETASFVALNETNRMMVISKDPTIQPQVRRWISQLDRSPADQARQRYLYNIQHYDPQELQTVLQQTYAGKATVGNAQPDDSLMRFVFAPEARQIIIDATPNQYTEIASLLRVLDRPPQQVQLQAVIAEVTLSDALEYGVEYFLSLQTGEGTLELIGDALSLPASTGSAFFVATDGFALIEALDRESDVRVLSTPTVTVRDSIEATIQVGGETPVLQSVIDSGGQTGGNTDLRNEIVFRDTGIKLTVQPHINESGYVTMKIVQEVNDAVANTTSGIDSPEFTTRLIETEVVAPHGATVLLGGIIDTQETVRVDRIPVLGELPVVGPLFSMNRDMVDRTELIITITPTIIDDPTAAAIYTTDFMRSVRSIEDIFERWAPAVPDALVEPVRAAQNEAAAGG